MHIVPLTVLSKRKGHLCREQSKEQATLAGALKDLYQLPPSSSTFTLSLMTENHQMSIQTTASTLSTYNRMTVNCILSPAVMR